MKEKVTINPELDGVSHINVYSRGKTNLGKFLSNCCPAKFTHPEDGEFNSVEGYWYWLGCKDDRLRLEVGWRAEELGRELGAPDRIDGDEFKRKIKLALKAKLEANPKWLEALKKNSLPLLHYYNYNGKVVQERKADWILLYLESFKS